MKVKFLININFIQYFHNNMTNLINVFNINVFNINVDHIKRIF
jgi:hypothetical protein